MDENITVEQALEKLEQISDKWVERDLEKGIAIPFRHCRRGRCKERLFFIFWRSVIVPFIFGFLVIRYAVKTEWSVFAILLVCYVLYWMLGIWLCRREQGSFILKMDGVTIVLSREKIYVPWNAIMEIRETVYANKCNLVIQAKNKQYIFYEAYARKVAMDSDGRFNPAMMPLHIAYKLLKAAQNKVNSI